MAYLPGYVEPDVTVFVMSVPKKLKSLPSYSALPALRVTAPSFVCAHAVLKDGADVRLLYATDSLGHRGLLALDDGLCLSHWDGQVRMRRSGSLGYVACLRPFNEASTLVMAVDLASLEARIVSGLDDFAPCAGWCGSDSRVLPALNVFTHVSRIRTFKREFALPGSRVSLRGLIGSALTFHTFHRLFGMPVSDRSVRVVQRVRLTYDAIVSLFPDGRTSGIRIERTQDVPVGASPVWTVSLLPSARLLFSSNALLVVGELVVECQTRGTEIKLCTGGDDLNCSVPLKATSFLGQLRLQPAGSVNVRIASGLWRASDAMLAIRCDSDVRISVAASGDDGEAVAATVQLVQIERVTLSGSAHRKSRVVERRKVLHSMQWSGGGITFKVPFDATVTTDSPGWKLESRSDNDHEFRFQVEHAFVFKVGRGSLVSDSSVPVVVLHSTLELQTALHAATTDAPPIERLVPEVVDASTTGEPPCERVAPVLVDNKRRRRRHRKPAAEPAPPPAAVDDDDDDDDDDASAALKSKAPVRSSHDEAARELRALRRRHRCSECGFKVRSGATVDGACSKRGEHQDAMRERDRLSSLCTLVRLQLVDIDSDKAFAIEVAPQSSRAAVEWRIEEVVGRRVRSLCMLGAPVPPEARASDMSAAELEVELEAEPPIACRHCGAQNDASTLFCSSCARLLASRLARAPWSDNLDADCAICCDEFVVGDTVSFLPCMHHFHSFCVADWLDTKSKQPQCPVCNHKIDAASLSCM